MELWINKIIVKKLCMFQTLVQLVEEVANEIDIRNLYGLIQEHLKNINFQIRKYFSGECSISFSLSIPVYLMSLKQQKKSSLT